MDKATRRLRIGFSILGAVMLLGAVLLWDARATIALNVARQEEAARPAEIELTLLAPSACALCLDGSRIVEAIEKQNVRILKSETLSADSQEGRTLTETYGVPRAPAILIRGEYNKENIRESLAAFGGEEKEGTLVIEAKQPVYVDLASNETIGLVDVTYLADSSCPDCYNPAIHKMILENTFGLTIQTETTVDAQSAQGRALLKEYALAQTPSVLLSSQARAYALLAETWKQVGTIEENGTFVFRQNAALGPVVYKDVKAGTIIRPTTSD